MVEGDGLRIMVFSHQTDKNFVNQSQYLKMYKQDFVFPILFRFSYAIQIYKFQDLFENCNDSFFCFCFFVSATHISILLNLKFTKYLLIIYWDYFSYSVFLGDPS